MERLCEDLKEHATKITDYEKKEMIPLTDKEISLIKPKSMLNMPKRI